MTTMMIVKKDSSQIYGVRKRERDREKKTEVVKNNKEKRRERERERDSTYCYQKYVDEELPG